VRERSSIFSALKQVRLPLTPILAGGPRRIVQERDQWASGCNFFTVSPGVVIG
jgi:arginine deiminase